MTQDQYNKLTEGEKLIYNELHGFAQRFSAQLEGLAILMKKAIEDANDSGL